MNRYIKRISVFFVLVIAISIVGCNKESKEEVIQEGQYYLYYVDKSGTDLQTEIYTPESEEITYIVEDMLKYLSKNTVDVNKLRTIPQGVDVWSVILEGKKATVDLSEEYENLDSVQSIICRSSIVLTLTQLDEINTVELTVEGSPTRNSKGEVVGELAEDDFVDASIELVNAYTKVNITLYYSNEQGEKLKPYTYDGILANDISVERYVLEQLINGPEEEGYGKVMSPDVELLDVTIKDDICYVNFSKDFLTINLEVKDYLTIYSIVNSLAELSHISSVQILIDGESDMMYNNNVDLSQYLVKNMSIVEGTKETNR